MPCWQYVLHHQGKEMHTTLPEAMLVADRMWKIYSSALVICVSEIEINLVLTCQPVLVQIETDISGRFVNLLVTPGMMPEFKNKGLLNAIAFAIVSQIDVVDRTFGEKIKSDR